MALKTTTTWSMNHWQDGEASYAELARETGDTDLAELVVDSEKVQLDVSQLRELSKAAGLIADEIEASK